MHLSVAAVDDNHETAVKSPKIWDPRFRLAQLSSVAYAKRKW